MSAQASSDSPALSNKHDASDANYFSLPPPRRPSPSPPFAATAFAKAKFEKANPKNAHVQILSERKRSASSANSTPRQSYHHTRVSPFGVDPPRPPHDGFEDVAAPAISSWESVPYFFPPTTPAASAVAVAAAAAAAKPLSVRVCTFSQTPEEQLQMSGNDSSVPNPPVHTKGLYGRAKKTIEAKLRAKRRICPSIPEHDSAASTSDLTRSYLNVHATTNRLKEELGKAKLTRKLFGKAPWHRKMSGGSFSSVTSSVREALRSGTPPVTPLAEYTANVDCPTCPQYPGGEAVRVNTPPLDEDTADGRPRGFFTATTPPVDYGGVALPPTSIHPQEGPRPKTRRRSIGTQPREWWDTAPRKPVRRSPYGHQATHFEFQVPEHLPSSPMCPANPKHISGGTGLCVYHGRGRIASGIRSQTYTSRSSKRY
ncbi:hypothetical protein G7046_g4235 [Stylonectria norvegica]|nr:hypothetical protein G7046_g4235 [Stylonectria norvegica]